MDAHRRAKRASAAEARVLDRDMSREALYGEHSRQPSENRPNLTPPHVEVWHQPTPRRRRRAATGPRAITGLCLIASATAIGCGGGSGPAPSPAPPASPSAVVRAYVTALNSHDTARARKLMTPEWAGVVSRQVDGWFTNLVRIQALRIGRPRSDRAVGSARHHRFVLYVPVTFNLSQKKQTSMRNGPTTWGYVLVRDQRSARWQIDGDGAG